MSARTETDRGLAVPSARALLVIDEQNDFCEGGSLAVPGGAAVAAATARFVETRHGDYRVIASTQDWHVDPGAHFASAVGEDPDFSTTWPDHCVAGTYGAELHPSVAAALGHHATALLRKGQRRAAYSGFEATDGATSLPRLLRAERVTDVEVCGIATDYCVRATVLDALDAGYRTSVRVGLCAAVAPASGAAALREMREAGAVVIEPPSPGCGSMDVDALVGGVASGTTVGAAHVARAPIAAGSSDECGIYMPVARKRCVLRRGHPRTVHHSSVRR